MGTRVRCRNEEKNSAKSARPRDVVVSLCFIIQTGLVSPSSRILCIVKISLALCVCSCVFFHNNDKHDN